MSYSTVIGTSNFAKLYERTPSESRNWYIKNGVKHHDRFEVVESSTSDEEINFSKIPNTITITMKDKNNRIIRFTASRSTFNLMFTVAPTRVSARGDGVKYETHVRDCLNSNIDFFGKDQLVDIVGPFRTIDTHPKEQKRPLLVNPIRITLSHVNDVLINKIPISIKGTTRKSSTEVRLISSGIRGNVGFTDSPSPEEDVLRSQLLQAIGMSPQVYNSYFGYNNPSITDEPSLVAQLISDAFGECVYFHRLNETRILVKNYTKIRPVVTVLSTPIIRGFDRLGNKHPEVRYNVDIDGQLAVATFMVRIDNAIYTKPNILQIKVKYEV